MPAPPSRSAWSRLTRASVGTTNLVVGGAAAVGAAAFHSLPVLAVGAVAYAALVAWDLVSGSTKSGAPDAGEPVRLRVATTRLDPLSFSDERTRATLQVIVAARGSIDRVVADAPAEVHEQIDTTLGSLAELEERAAHLANRGEAISRYLRTARSRAGLQRDCEQLAARIAQEADEETMRQLRSALDARRSHLAAVDDLTRAKERIDATLLSVASTLDGLSARIVRASGADTHGVAADDVREELANMNIEIGTFEETLKTLAEIDP